jgi:hypothetical protein
MEPEDSSPPSQGVGRTERSVWFRGFFEYIVTCLICYAEESLASRLTPKLEDHSLSAVRECLFSIFAATSATWGRAMT